MPIPVSNTRLTPNDLESAPQLAALVVLDATIDIAVQVLVIAGHPELTDDERPYWLEERSPSHDIAKRIVALAIRLQDTIAQYRHAIAQEHEAVEPPDDDLDF